ncbi:MAG: hypothetical protein C4289_06190, partial [Chloroflexota bacterium]
MRVIEMRVIGTGYPGLRLWLSGGGAFLKGRDPRLDELTVIGLGGKLQVGLIVGDGLLAAPQCRQTDPPAAMRPGGPLVTCPLLD